MICGKCCHEDYWEDVVVRLSLKHLRVKYLRRNLCKIEGVRDHIVKEDETVCSARPARTRKLPAKFDNFVMYD